MSPAPFYPVAISSALYTAQSMYPVMALVRDKCVLHHFLRPATLALPSCDNKRLNTAVILYLSHLHQIGIRIQNSRNAIKIECDRKHTCTRCVASSAGSRQCLLIRYFDISTVNGLQNQPQHLSVVSQRPAGSLISLSW